MEIVEERVSEVKRVHYEEKVRERTCTEVQRFIQLCIFRRFGIIGRIGIDRRGQERRKLAGIKR